MAKRRSTGKNSKQPRDLRDALRAAGPLPSHAGAHTIEQAAEVAMRRVLWHRQRAQIAETQRKRARLSDPALVQERHSPTVEIAVDDPEGKRRARRNITRVRQSEAWRHNNLDTMQRQAETEMLSAWMLRTEGLAMASMRLDRVGAGALAGAVFDRAVHLDQTWREWVDESLRRKVHVYVVVMIFNDGRTLPEVERIYGLKRGRAIELYRDGLDLWSELRGWTRRPHSRTVDTVR